MSKKLALALCFLTFTYALQRHVDAAPFNNEDGNAVIVIPLKTSNEQVTKIKSFKIDGRTAIKQLTSRVSAEKILRTLSNVPEFDVLVEGLDAVTLGDVYKAAFPNGILQLIGAQYLPSFKSSFKHHKGNIFKPVVSVTNATELPFTDEKLDESIGNKTEYPYDEVHEDESQNKNEELKEEPITDDYVYDQPIEDRLKLDLEHVAAENDDESKQKIKDEDGRDSKTLFLEKSQNELVNAETLKKKEVSKYGGQFRNWITNMLTG